MKRMNFFLPDSYIAKLRAMSAETGLPVSELIRRAIDEFLKKQK